MAMKKRDPLLHLGGARIAAAAWLQEVEREGGTHHVTARTLLLVFSSCATFAVSVSSVAEFFHRAPLSTLVAVGQLAVLGLLLETLWREERWHPWLGRFISVSAIVGMLVGLNLYYGQLVYYYHYQLASALTDVAPSQDSAFFGDAGMLRFTSDTWLDSSRSVGYQDPETGELLCLAPIVDSLTVASSPITVFAAGVNCCNFRARFRCGDATDAKVRSALLYLPAEQLVSPLMAWTVQDDDLIDGFKRATKLQASVFDMVVSDAPRFVRWTGDPRREVDEYLRRAVNKGLFAGAVFFVVSLVGAIAVAAGQRRIFRLLDKHLAGEPWPGERIQGDAAPPPEVA